MTENGEQDIGAIFDEGTAVDEAMRKGWYRAVRRHRRLGIPLLVSEDGEIVELDPFEVELPDEEVSMPDRDTYQRTGN